MINFLRKFRFRLMPGGAVARYLGYAIGEIVLLVIGILIALQVNDWNEARKDHATEQVLLQSLRQEFESNQRILEQAIALNRANIASGLELGAHTGPVLGTVDERALSRSMVGVFKDDPHFNPNQGTSQEIINSGRLSLLSDPELRKAISSWQSDLARLKNQEAYVLERRDIAHEFFLKNGNFRGHLHLIGSGPNRISPSRFPPNQFKFLESQEFESQLYLFIVASRTLDEDYYLPLKQKLRAINRLIDEDLRRD